MERFGLLIGVVILFNIVPLMTLAVGEDAQDRAPLHLGSRWEPIVDRYLIERLDGADLRLTPPQRREVVLTLDKPWEGPASAYFTVFKDGDIVRLYYRGYCPSDDNENTVTCLAESTDGIHFTRPNLGLYEFQGSRENNIVYRGLEAHNFAPVLDTRPGCPATERYKAVGGINSRLYAFSSPDGVRWTKLQPDPVMTRGAFDSLNVAFWDSVASAYRCYSRAWTGGGYAGFRAIQSATSSDFVHWAEPVMNRYADGVPMEHFYTNATVPCPGAEHILLSFPKRFMPARTKLSGYAEPGVSDAVFMSSRDGIHWDRTFLEAWLRPGLDQRNWTQRSNMPAWGIVETGDEYSLYVSEHYDWPDCRLRRVTVPRHRFASIHAGAREGTAVTRPLILSGKELVLNYATSAAGSVRIELLAEDGSPIPGFAASDFQTLYGDEMDAVVRWSGKPIAEVGTRPVRFRFLLADADIYAFRVAP